MAAPESGYHAIVDMGSNGIRCSVANLSASSHPRLLSTIYSDRIPISLHDAQYPEGTTTRQALSEQTVRDVVLALQRFKHTCEDFGVPNDNVTLVATEATRTAINADEFLNAIEKALGWSVKLLSKGQEAAAGAMGVATSVPVVDGLVMDLGGGSVQLTKVNTKDSDWHDHVDDNAISLPYGAAALLKRIDAAKSSSEEQKQLKVELTQALKQALTDLRLDEKSIPDADRKSVV